MITELEKVTIATADLTKIMKRVAKENPDWSKERLNKAEIGYRSYIADVNHDKSLSPSKDVDEVWHTHILHTVDYADFCQLHFGRFIHHVPDENGCHPGTSCTKSSSGNKAENIQCGASGLNDARKEFT